MFFADNFEDKFCYTMFDQKVKGYKRYTDLEFQSLYNLLREKGAKDFRATQHDQYVKDGFFPIFSRGDGNVTTFVDIDMTQCAQILCRLDQLREFEYNPKVVPLPRVYSDPRRHLLDGQPYPPETFIDRSWAEDYVHHYYYQRVEDLRVILQGIPDKNCPIYIPGDGAGVGYAAANAVGFKEVYSFDLSPTMIDIAKNYGNIVQEMSFENMCLNLPDNAVVLLSHVMDYLPMAIVKLKDYKVIVFEQNSFYPGFHYLTPTGHCEGNQVSTNIVGYITQGRVSLSNREVKVTESFNLDLIRSYDVFCFVGDESMATFRYMLMIDIERTKQYYVIGVGSKHFDKAHFVSVIDGKKVLYVIGGIIDYPIEIRDGDSIYNTRLRHEMSVKYLSRIMPYLGYITLDVLYRFGFPTNIKIPNAIEYNAGIIGNTVTTDMQIGLPYIIPSAQFVKFVHTGGMEDSNVVADIFPLGLGFDVLRPKKLGVLTYASRCIHVDMTDNSQHSHVCSIQNDVPVPVFGVSRVVFANSNENYPIIFSERNLRNELVVKFNRPGFNADLTFSLIKNDCRIRYSSILGLYFNPYGRSNLLDEDFKLLLSILAGYKIDIIELFERYFDVLLSRGPQILVDRCVKFDPKHFYHLSWCSYEFKGNLFIDIDKYKVTSAYKGAKSTLMLDYGMTGNVEGMKSPGDIGYFYRKQNGQARVSAVIFDLCRP